jgi:rRNA maturation endonuclease Nob1
MRIEYEIQCGECQEIFKDQPADQETCPQCESIGITKVIKKLYDNEDQP